MDSVLAVGESAPLHSLKVPASQAVVELSIVVPTFCEAENVAVLVERVEDALSGHRWEIIFVDDDSADHTAERAKTIASQDQRVRCIRRVGRRGLAGACIEGILSSAAPFVAVMDADLQHDETLLPRMLEQLESGEIDLVAATRYAGEGAGAEGLANARRGQLSRIANASVQRLLSMHLTDPMSGFFMLRREIVEAHADDLCADGFKILLDIVATAGSRLRIAEVPYRFRPRQAGESKFDTRTAIEFAGLVLSKLSFGVVTPRFLVYALVGTTGLGVHMLALLGYLAFDGNHFAPAQLFATGMAITNNYVLNNLLTWRDRRLRGWQMVRGFAGFCLISTAGAIANIGVAEWLFAQEPKWWLAGFAGAVMGAVWNYSMSSRLVWQSR
ncbi:MAG: glycosyltransferase family 2 protein [Alphaproteobacteria bacterium]|nr:glycosyltransferase family 2 protein [Alphaproteobacteria bacterium]